MKIKDNDHYGLYFGDPRYEKVWEQMKLLGIQDVTTMRQHKNGTIVWKLPIKNKWKKSTFIEVASFSTGYVRNQNSGYSNYQLNKRKFEDEYFQDYEWKNGEQIKIKNQYRKWSRKTCVLIPIEIDRLEYLISYCLKNYYIKHANQVANGEYVPKWEHEWELERSNNAGHDMLHEQKQYENKRVQAVKDRYKAQLEEFDFGDCDRIRELEEKLENMTEARDYYQNHYVKIKEFDSETKKKYLKIKDLEDKLDEAQSTYGNNSGAMERITDLEAQLSMYKGDVVVEWKYTDALTKIKDLENKLDTIQRISDYE